jgi:hypothetical protein
MPRSPDATAGPPLLAPDAPLRALVGAFLRRQRVAHNASDVRLVALDFAVPMEAGSVDPEEMVARQRHCPEAIIRQVMAMRSRA